MDGRDATVLEQRSQGRSLREVGEVLGLSPERIRQIEQRAKARVRELLLAAGLGEEVACPS
jgi:DNA-directed RNA polymerase sigma subunit (sigma70/sigma32)